MSNLAERVLGRRNYGRNTQNAGTVIVQLIEPWAGARTRLTGVTVTTLATAHILTLLRPCNMTTFTAAGAAAQKVVNVAADPGVYAVQGTLATADTAIAGSDYVVYQAADGTYVVDTVDSVSSLAITLVTDLPTGGVAVGGKLWFYGIVTETNPNNNQAHPRYNLKASTTNTLGRGDNLGTIPDHKYLNIGDGKEQPLLLIIDNGTNASILEAVGVEYYRPAAA